MNPRKRGFGCFCFEQITDLAWCESGQYTKSMSIGLAVDRSAIAHICRTHNVSRLTIFGSATSAKFDSKRSDVDFLVEFASGSPDAFGEYFGLKEDLESLLGRPVDLVMASAVRNPYFTASAARGAEEVYAA